MVVTGRIVGLQHAQAVADGQARCHHQEATRETLALGMADRIDGLPDDQHRHDGGLASSGCAFQRQAHQLRVGIAVGIGEVIEEALARVAGLGSHLCKPDGHLDGLDPAEERANAAKLVVPPVLEQAGRLRRNLPLARVRQGPPPVHLLADAIDDSGR
jgi:hypothetical protein